MDISYDSTQFVTTQQKHIIVYISDIATLLCTYYSYTYTQYMRGIIIIMRVYRKMINLTYGGGEVIYSVATVSGNGQLV